MLKPVLLGLWIIAVTAAAAFGSIFVIGPIGQPESSPPGNEGLEELKAEMTSIPLMRDGEVNGYLIIQLAFEADRTVLAEQKIEPAPFLNDAAFRVIFARTDLDFRHPRAADLEKLTANIAEEANRRIGAPLVRHVLIEQLNYVRKEDIRTNWIGKNKSEP